MSETGAGVFFFGPLILLLCFLVLVAENLFKFLLGVKLERHELRQHRNRDVQRTPEKTTRTLMKLKILHLDNKVLRLRLSLAHVRKELL